MLKSPTDWVGISPNPDSNFGFIYTITNLMTGEKYIGKKQYWSIRRVAVPGRKNKKKVTSESDWKKYKSSCKPLKEQIKKMGNDQFKFEIVLECATKAALTYNEVNLQHRCEVLVAKLDNGEAEYYNKQIGAIKFIPPASPTPEDREAVARDYSESSNGV